MNDLIASMINGYLSAFDSYQIKDDSLQKEVNSYKKKLTDFAKSFSDIVEFSTKFAVSGLQEEYSALISKVAMANLEPPAQSNDVKSENSSGVVSVKDFLEQYRASYNEIIKAKYRKRGKAAYEKIFEVADKTDDMLDAQIMLERDRLLWKIVPEDSLDIFETILEAMDPIWEATTTTLIKNIESYKKAESEEELLYLLDLAEFDRMPAIQNNIILMSVTVLFGLLLRLFDRAKKIIYEWPSERAVQRSIGNMAYDRRCLRRALAMLKEHYNMTFDDLLKTEKTKLWLLHAAGIGATARIKTMWHTYNFDVLKDIMDNEIIPDITIDEILMRKLKSMMGYMDEDLAGKEEFDAKARKRAEELNAHLAYYQYIDELSQYSKDFEEDIKKQQENIKKQQDKINKIKE
ncbi:MAG: hypothetical protein FWF73_06625 [Spirochaetes bacterium]|nr:hypothetical protein [Spirochaetota bacterium]